jgi:hypothetical protein
MIRQRLRKSLLASVVMAVAALPVRAGDAAPAVPNAPLPNPPAIGGGPVPFGGHAPYAAGAPHGAPCGPQMRTICVTEWVPQQYETCRTVYRQQCFQEKYTAYRTECVPQTVTRCVTVNQMVPEVREVVKTVCVPVTTCEQRTVMKTVTVCKPVTTVTRKCVDMGHYECREVPCSEGLLTRLHKHHHKNDCCAPCPPCPPPTKTVKVWVPNKVWVETPCTKMVRCKECVPTTVTVRVCRMVPQQRVERVCCYKCVPVQKTVTCTVMTTRCVPYEACRTVTRCVPVQEKVVCCRMVPRVVEKQVPVETCCEAAPCCTTSCGGSGGSFFHRAKHCCH